jgi:hypothetical protein
MYFLRKQCPKIIGRFEKYWNVVYSQMFKRDARCSASLKCILVPILRHISGCYRHEYCHYLYSGEMSE